MKRVCSVLLIVSLCPWMPLVQGVEAQGTSAVAPPSPQSAPTVPLAFGGLRLAAALEASAAVPLSAAARPSSGSFSQGPGASRRFNKPLLVSGIALAGGGMALNLLSYREESYSYSYCPGCNPPLTTTLYRDTTSGAMYWGGIATASAGAALLVWSFFKK